MNSAYRLVLALVSLAMVHATAKGANVYANALTNQSSILSDFDDYSYLDPGVGTFDASPDYGLQVLSQAPNSYHGIKIRKAVAPKTSDLQVQVFSHVSSSIDPTQSQTNPNYAAGIYLFKYVTNPDGSPNLVEAQKNFVKIELARNLDFEGTQQYLHYRFDSDGTVFDDYIPLGTVENLTLRINYSAMDGRISVAYADGPGGFKTCPVIFAGWDAATTDGLLVGLLATTFPFGDPAPPATYSVKPGEVYLRDLEVSSSPTVGTGDFLLSLENSTNNLSSWTPVSISAGMLNGEGKVIVPGPGSSSKSFFRMRIDPALP
jgi:hypothetical protein